MAADHAMAEPSPDRDAAASTIGSALHYRTAKEDQEKERNEPHSQQQARGAYRLIKGNAT